MGVKGKIPEADFSPSGFLSLSLPPNCFWRALTICLMIIEDMAEMGGIDRR